MRITLLRDVISCCLVLSIAYRCCTKSWSTSIFHYTIRTARNKTKPDVTSHFVKMNVTTDELIIHFVRENPCIYDKKSRSYKNTQKKEDVWKTISQELKNVDVVMSGKIEK